MTAKHTRGPWRKHGDYYIESPDQAIVGIAANLGHDPVRWGEMIANQALIAAAPDLLAACEEVCSMLESDDEDCLAKIHLSLSSAIKKARGES